MNEKKEIEEIIETFSEERRNSFVTLHDLKEEGKPIVGMFCTYLPVEIVMAMGGIPVVLCSTSEETIPDAEQDLPRNLCPLIKSSYGFAKTEKCPFFYFSDLIVGETTCDGKKKMYEYLGQFKKVYVMELPNRQSEDGLILFKNELIRFVKYLEEMFHVTITEENLREAVRLKNRERIALMRFYRLMRYDPTPITGTELFHVLNGVSYRFDKEQEIEQLNLLCDAIEKRYKEGKCLEKKPRILVTGSPVGGGAFKVVTGIEENGGVVVTYENCSGAKSIEGLVDEECDDIYEALAKRYLAIGCSCMSPNQNRYDLLGRLIEEYKADGVIDVVLQACHTYSVETLGIKQYVKEKYHIPYMAIETDYSTGDIGQLNTRLTAFLEML